MPKVEKTKTKKHFENVNDTRQSPQGTTKRLLIIPFSQLNFTFQTLNNFHQKPEPNEESWSFLSFEGLNSNPLDPFTLLTKQ